LYQTPFDPPTTGWQYWGCFSPLNFLRPFTPQIVSGASPATCTAACLAQNIDFAVLRGNQCYCVPTSPSPSQSSITCSTGCVGSSCPLWTFKRTITTLPVPLPAFPEPRGFSFNGCYRANAWIQTAISLGNANGIVQCSSLSTSRSLSYCALVGSNCYGSTISISTSFKAGIGQCSTPCSANPLESCGSAPQTLPARRGSIVARQTEDPAIFATVYGPQDVVPATVAAPVPGTAADVTGWSDAGCYNSELYLLDSLLTGFSYSVAADPTATLDGSTCITTCANQDASNLYAITLGTTCYCTATPPPADSLAADQTSCNLPCQGAPTERCGGKGAVGTTNVFGTVYSKIAPVCPLFPILCSMLNAQ
jgi:hypothetical protein